MRATATASVLAYGGDDQFESFAWRAECLLTIEHWLTGQFTAIGPRIEGLFRLKLDPFGSIMQGYWLGISRDSEHTIGLLVVGRDHQVALRRADTDRAQHQDLPSLPEKVRCVDRQTENPRPTC